MINKWALFILLCIPTLGMGQGQPGLRFASVLGNDSNSGASPERAKKTIAACLTALPSTGGTCDATGLIGAQTLSSTVTVPANTTVLLGAGQFTSSVCPLFTLGNSSVLRGLASENSTAATTLTYSGSSSCAMIKATNQSTGSYHTQISRLHLVHSSSPTADGTIALDMLGMYNTQVQDFVADFFDTGVRLGSGSQGSYYNTLAGVQ